MKINARIVKILFFIVSLICLSGVMSSALALMSGILFYYLLDNPYPKISQRAVNLFLKIAVIGFGFGINVMDAIKVSKDSILLTASSILIIMISGYLISGVLKLKKETSHLINTGTAICGGSAIAAVAPITGASNQTITISLGVVFLLNSISLVIFPPLGQLLNLSEYQFGLWSAIAIHDTSSVVGAAYAYGEESLKVATTVKMSRVLWIIPISLYSIFLFKRKNARLKIPWFILLFVAAILINSYLHIPNVMQTAISISSKSLLILTLFLIGMSLSIEQIKKSGWKVLLFGFSLWIIMACYSLLFIL